mgnify:CR=1 FL=1
MQQRLDQIGRTPIGPIRVQTGFDGEGQWCAPLAALRIDRRSARDEQLHDQGTISEKWNSPGTPVYYFLDTSGVIRYKWVGNPGEKAIDAGLETLIQEAERDAATGPNSG